MGVTLLKMRWSPRCPVIASPCEWIIMSAKSNGKLKLVTTEMPSSWPGKVYEPGIALGEVLYRTSLKELLPYIEETGELHQWIILICHIHIIIKKLKHHQNICGITRIIHQIFLTQKRQNVTLNTTLLTVKPFFHSSLWKNEFFELWSTGKSRGWFLSAKMLILFGT